MIVVIDANVWISAFLNKVGIPAQVVDACLRGAATIATSRHLLNELERVVEYDRVRNVLVARGINERVRTTLALLRRTARFVSDLPPTDQWVADDPDDDWVIQCALTANAEYIVSGDRHLLSLEKVGSVRILSPADFVGEVLDEP
jgi:putative PIN family toxin of toxin-antitoxin system